MARFPDIKNEVKFLTFQRECERLFQVEGDNLDQRKLYHKIHSNPTLRSDGPFEMPEFYREPRRAPIHDTEKQDMETDNDPPRKEPGFDNSTEELPVIDEEDAGGVIEHTRNELGQLQNMSQLEQRIKNADSLIHTALTMVANTKKLLKGFIELFESCLLKQSDKGRLN